MVTNADCVTRMKDADAVRVMARKLVEVFGERLPEAGWCIHGGTALSAYLGRGKPEGGVVLPGDNDIDITILAETVSPAELTNAFDEAGFKRGYFFHDKLFPQVGVVLRFFFDGVPVDCYWLYKRGRKRWWVTAPRVAHVLPAYLFERLGTATFLGVEMPAPDPLEAYVHNKWKRVGDRFPGKSQGGECLDFDWDWPIYDDQTGFREQYARRNGMPYLWNPKG